MAEIRKRLSLWVLTLACRLMPEPYFRLWCIIAKLFRAMAHASRNNKNYYGHVQFSSRDGNMTVTTDMTARMDMSTTEAL